jgi:hypothetical protein
MPYKPRHIGSNMPGRPLSDPAVTNALAATVLSHLRSTLLAAPLFFACGSLGHVGCPTSRRRAAACSAVRSIGLLGGGLASNLPSVVPAIPNHRATVAIWHVLRLLDRLRATIPARAETRCPHTTKLSSRGYLLRRLRWKAIRTAPFRRVLFGVANLYDRRPPNSFA